MEEQFVYVLLRTHIKTEGIDAGTDADVKVDYISSDEKQVKSRMRKLALSLFSEYNNLDTTVLKDDYIRLESETDTIMLAVIAYNKVSP